MNSCSQGILNLYERLDNASIQIGEASEWCGKYAPDCTKHLDESGTFLSDAGKVIEVTLQNCKNINDTCTSKIQILETEIHSAASLLKKATSDCKDGASACVADVQAASEKIEGAWSSVMAGFQAC